jgi:aldose 1-epimerase
MKVTHKIETHTRAGEPVIRFTVENSFGATVEFTNWGARWITVSVPDANGALANVLVGYEELSDYLDDTYYMGATVGRFANRIARASLVINGKTCHLETNDGPNTNHGGYSGFHQKLWQWEELPDGVRFRLDSPDGEGGYPGNVCILAEYRFNEQNELLVRHRAETDCATYINMTNHAYFNLSGTDKKITEHWLQIPSHRILDTTSEFIPTGKRIRVEGTPFDFTVPKQIGKDLYEDNEQLRWNKGYNHYYILKDELSAERVQAAVLYDSQTGRKLIVQTDLPGVMLYTAGYYEKPDTAVCLETQFYPDTPSHPDFPSCLLRPGEVYEHHTLFSFKVAEK